MLKIFSDQKYLVPGFTCHMLLPFWSQQLSLDDDPDARRFDKYIEQGNHIFEMVPLEYADVTIYPSSPTSNWSLFTEFQHITNNKPMAVFFNDDLDVIIPRRNGALLFRTSFYRSTRQKTEFALPGWSADYGTLPVRSYRVKPVVGFCGSLDRWRIRELAMFSLEAHPDIETHFIRRPNFWGRWASMNKIQRGTIHLKERQEFLQNMTNSDYILCARGGGNFSYRIYETMMSGRIPLLVDTDCVLPYDFLINWDKLFPIINQNDISHIGDMLLEFHNSFPPGGFEERQCEMRKLWEEWISPVGFFSNFYKHFQRGN